MDFAIWCLKFLLSFLDPTAEYPPTACQMADHIITANYDEEGKEPRFDHRLMPIVVAVYPYCRQEFVARGSEELGSKWRPGMKLRESKQFRIQPAFQNVYYCDPIDWGALAKLAEFTGQPVEEVNLWRREQAIDLLYASERKCEGCGDYHWMLLNPGGYDELMKAGELEKGLQEAAADIGKEYFHFFTHGYGSCNASDEFLSDQLYYDSENLSSGISWFQKAGWTNNKIKKQLQLLVPELRFEDQGRQRVKEAVQAVNNELAKL